MTVEPVTPDHEHLADLVTFARLEIESADVEPWAMIMRALRQRDVVDDEGAAWLVKCYNAYDSFHSAWSVFRRWPSPYAWAAASDRADAANYECTQERRNLRGGRVLRHLDDYVTHLAGQNPIIWASQGIVGDDPNRDFARLTTWLRQVWGVGRQTAFEWAEFLAKVCGLPVDAGDAQLWESEGPRRSLQRLYGNPKPSPRWLDERAHECKAMLAAAGVELAWWDFETIICDFNVMRDGRYYVGRHLAALRGEIDECPEEDRDLLLDVFRTMLPEGWRDIAPNIDPDKKPIYRDTGKIIDAP